jgi:hypothetical protein
LLSGTWELLLLLLLLLLLPLLLLLLRLSSAPEKVSDVGEGLVDSFGKLVQWLLLLLLRWLRRIRAR